MKLFVLLLIVSAFNLITAQIVPNGDFEKSRIWKNRNIPFDWGAALYDDDKAEITLDDKVKHGGEKSLKLSSEIPKSRVVVTSKEIPVPTGKKDIYVSLWIKSQVPASGEGKVVLIGYDKNNKTSIWKALFMVRGSFDWRKFSKKLSLPAGTIKYRLSVRLNKGGTIWYDDVSASFEPPAPEKLKKEVIDSNKLTWEKYTVPGAENIFTVEARDDNVTLIWKDGLANFGMKSSPVPIVKNRSIAFSALVKTAGKGVGQLMIRAFGVNGNLLLESKSPELSDAGKGKTLRETILTPVWTASVRLFCLNKGPGTVNFSDIKLQNISPDEMKSRYPVSFSCEPAIGNDFWNNGNAVFNTIDDSPGPLVFDFWGDKSISKNLALIVELPDEITIEQCFHSHASVAEPVVKPQVTAFTKDGHPWKRYSYRNAWCFVNMKPNPGFCRSLAFIFKRMKNGVINKEYPAYAYLSNAGKKSPVKKFYVNFLPPLPKTPNPKHYTVFTWSSWDTAVTGDKLFLSVLKKFEEAGMTSRGCNTWGSPRVFKQDRICADRGWQLVAPMGTQVFENAFKKKYGAAAQSVKSDGKKVYHTCPSLLLSEPGKQLIDQAVREILDTTKMKKGDVALFDYEPWQALDWCYCPKCLERFAAFSGVKATPQEIKKKYWREWARFRVKDSNAILKCGADAVKKYKPEITVADYDYPLDFRKDDLLRRFFNIPKDSRLSDKYLDTHYLSYYYYHGKRGFEFLDVNAKKLKKPFVMFSLLARYADPRQTYYARTIDECMTPLQFRQAMLNGASAGSIGHAIFPGIKIDGKYFVAIDTAMREIAAVEDAYRTGKRIDDKVSVKGEWLVNNPEEKVADFLCYRVHRLGDKTVITIFNFSRKAKIKCQVKLLFKSGDTRITDVSTGKNVKTAASAFDAVIPPSGVSIFTVEPKK